jgi:hypothetical protein
MSVSRALPSPYRAGDLILEGEITGSIPPYGAHLLALVYPRSEGAVVSTGGAFVECQFLCIEDMNGDLIAPQAIRVCGAINPKVQRVEAVGLRS